MVLKISQIHSNVLAGVSFSIKLQGEPAALLNRDPGTGVFL